MLPAFALAEAYKSRFKDGFVCVGGPHIPYITDALRRCPRPFEWVDAFVPGEGELPLAGICRSVTEGRDASRVKGLFARRNGEVVCTGPQEVVALDSLPPPDFSGFEPKTYLANGGSVGLAFARGCSWSRCAFCTQFVSYDGYRAMSQERIAEHVVAVTRRYQIRTISLNDENVTPARLREFGEVVRATAPGLRWMALARLSPKLADTELARELADSGCAMLSLGLESADQDVLNLNRKGISVQSLPAILRTLNDAGIWTHVFLIFGLPGESGASAVRTIRFAHENLGALDSLSPTTFRLERHSAVWAEPQSFGIVPAEVPGDWCNSAISFDTTASIRPGEAYAFVEYLIQSLLGQRQCPIEQGELNGQYILQLLAQLGVSGLRAAMEDRATMTSAARDALTADNTLFQRWLGHPSAASLLAGSGGNEKVLLTNPGRGVYLAVNRTGLTILKLRSLGLPLEDIKKLCALSGGPPDADNAEREWQVDTFNLLVLISRLVQEALGDPAGAAMALQKSAPGSPLPPT